MIRGWWKIEINGIDKDLSLADLNECDLEHIADLIKEGFREGEIIHEESNN